ncbi:MAG TPA: hypothetical protein VND93_24395 [Myxococcales bacterium]|nr:hypothetical protein [Myxococcales bacterium]
MARDPQDPNRMRWDNRPAELPTGTPAPAPDEGGPFTAGRIGSAGPIHIYGRDGSHIVATVHSPRAAELASKMAAAPELYEALERVAPVIADGKDVKDPAGLAAQVQAALEKARTPPATR